MLAPIASLLTLHRLNIKSAAEAALQPKRCGDTFSPVTSATVRDTLNIVGILGDAGQSECCWGGRGDGELREKAALKAEPSSAGRQ